MNTQCELGIVQTSGDLPSIYELVGFTSVDLTARLTPPPDQPHRKIRLFPTFAYFALLAAVAAGPTEVTPQVFDTLDQLDTMVAAHPQVILYDINGTWSYVVNTTVIAVASPTYGASIACAMNEYKCLADADTVNKRKSGGAHPKGCARRRCSNSSICWTYNNCHICAGDKRCL